jgi:hypothetical protein
MSAPVPMPTDAAVRRLQAASGYPMLSVLLRTSPGATMAPDDRRRLAALVDRAGARVERELGPSVAASATRPLRDLAARAAEQPTARGLALFAGDDVAESYRLTVPVDERTVVDPTFATRDLLRALATHPPVRVLALAADGARLFLAAHDQLTEIENPALPDPSPTEHPDRRGHQHQAELSHRRAVHVDRFFRAVDDALRRDPVLGHLPLVVAATEPVLGRFRQVARIPIAGTVRGHHLRRPPRELAAAVRPVVRAHVEAETRRDLARLADAVDRHQARIGLAEVWAAALDRRVRLLLVDQAYRVAGTPADDGRSIVVHPDPEAPDVLDDAVDELIELVHRAEAQVRFVPTDSIPHGVAAVVR